jgi:hypothetical protein
MAYVERIPRMRFYDIDRTFSKCASIDMSEPQSLRHAFRFVITLGAGEVSQAGQILKVLSGKTCIECNII